MGGWYVYFLMFTGAYSFVFIVIHLVSKANCSRAWNGWDTAVIAWGILYAFIALLFAYPGTLAADFFSVQAPERDYLVFLALVGIPGLITMLLVQSAWKSDLVGLSVLGGTALAFLIGVMAKHVGMVFIAPLVWNAAYAVGCALSIEKGEHIKPTNECHACGYSLVGLSYKTPCPECNTPSPPIEEAV